MDDDPSVTLESDLRTAVARLKQLCIEVLSDQLTVNRRMGQVNELLAGYAVMRADCAAIKAALAEDGAEQSA